MPQPAILDSEFEKPLIVVIDDEEDILENYRNLLEESYRVRSFSDPKAFLASIDGIGFENPALVITDLKMPSLDGLEMVRRAQKKSVYFPFILLSGFLNKQTAIEAIDIGAYRLLEKPTEFDVLSAAIDQLLIEHDIQQVRDEIRRITSQLRELYSSLRLVLGQYIPEEIIQRLVVDAPNGKVKAKMSFEDLLEALETRLDTLLESEKMMNEMRHNKTRA